MNYIIKKDGAEVNRIVADEAFCQQYYSDNGYSYEPVPPAPEPEPVEAEPTAEDDMAAMLIDHEYRLTLMELGLTEGGDG